MTVALRKSGIILPAGGGYGSQPHAPRSEQRCANARCGCRLSVYRQPREVLCAPCQAALRRAVEFAQ